jgi:deoxyribodipyrimidine photolyase-related protein
MQRTAVLFPHQLFRELPFGCDHTVYLIEEPLFFTQYPFHKAKIAFHRASMKAYEMRLKEIGYTVKYIETAESETARFLQKVWKDGIRNITLIDPSDYLLERRWHRESNKIGITLQTLASPNWMCSREYGHNFFKNKKKFFLTEFYIEQRKRFDLLMEGPQPQGGKWTFDTENRKKLPAGTPIPELPEVSNDIVAQEAIAYCRKHFGQNPGTLDQLIYPFRHKDAEVWLDRFLDERFSNYGVYQDAIVKEENFLFHSLLTPMLNTGLLQPETILEKAVQAARRKNIPINSTEGFVRQILGWREFIRIVYTEKGVQQRTTNYWNHHYSMPEAFYTGDTGIPPVDDAIRRTLDSGYAHHIERLMVLGNFMVLCEIHPDAVYRWFMEMYIDAYDWVMVPNVYGMSQFADGGIMSTKPYISGSNYLLKMSNYQKGEWCELWDALFWRFIHKHKTFFLRHPRMSMMVRLTEKMSAEKLSAYLHKADNFLCLLHGIEGNSKKKANKAPST